MEQAGADTGPIVGIVDALKAGKPLAEVLDTEGAGGPYQ